MGLQLNLGLIVNKGQLKVWFILGGQWGIDLGCYLFGDQQGTNSSLTDNKGQLKIRFTVSNQRGINLGLITNEEQLDIRFIIGGQ